jgi:SET domain-containing protein
MKGKGVFTSEAIAENTLIEIAPVIVLSAADLLLIEKTQLYNYYFKWGETQLEAVIALGYGSMYNHSYQPNVAYLMDYEGQTILFIAWKNIAAGEELFINYNGEEDDQTNVWFDQ